MANYTKGPLGAFSGKMGNIVGASWRSIDYMRSLPRPSNKPASMKQKEAREAFKIAHDFLSPLRELLRLSYPVKTGSKKSAFDLAMTTMITSMEGTYPDFKINYKNLVLSKGGLIPIQGEFSFNEQKDLIITWDPVISIGTAEGMDLLYVVLYDEANKDFFIEQKGEREDGSVVLHQVDLRSTCFHIWTFISSYNGLRFSNSMYHGVIEI